MAIENKETRLDPDNLAKMTASGEGMFERKPDSVLPSLDELRASPVDTTGVEQRILGNIREIQEARRGKLLNSDPEMFTTVIGNETSNLSDAHIEGYPVLKDL
ncbi:hypothetical protein A3F00_02525 [Candidatus Daviesbacteria bacterium RIFCSPHIGHO2_12_FULL_37_11]|uniref:Uncharacterized protein n=1 Tax=Candidatus Daviesbacteria bacterium RIFCSPHIGHO2_12_FULL_37_11 TaxID=1797777 RepID=A0A1F5KET3_9BACT|nr:MAG: hypothetical protein A2111_00015 [Candidatus Daviesbacteria bacterium GWA1_38_6]OGE16199.1 MAG: hypothetical protein A2769_03870 [Candidatus Daviesbacteria bacterium RIFCSPHIGHO2_01_FULL_37_27]OGE39310.1 MAG: hypothetical protein A3F00_02525 [Candidatus Daviesbacteria bacterium RIFCSPHIGHO2_12_FULL_37_11]OGE44767.1 MAG: hypothetical protein A3B39_05405 [Candidatus Daviesbacteria bacterium RIFCSPLOWO2_01_FULL_37_10]